MYGLTDELQHLRRWRKVWKACAYLNAAAVWLLLVTRHSCS